MDEIKQIYSGDSYAAFVDYCERHHFRQMRDLKNCRFEGLTERINITPALLSRIKSIFVLYLKKYPECPAAKPAQAKAAPLTDVLRQQLLAVFQQNANKLIHITDITKVVGKSVKRSDIVEALAQQPWCRVVDHTTFFYVPPAQ